MTIRLPKLQSEHDNVIKAAELKYKQFRNLNYTITTNPNQQQNLGIGKENTVYPDIIITNTLGVVTSIIEVETADSVSQTEAEIQWKEYAKLGYPFYLLVPEKSALEARIICLRNKIQARVITYKIVGGMILVDNLNI
jgi:hypothetical protein